jgi:hypothetical protein
MGIGLNQTLLMGSKEIYGYMRFTNGAEVRIKLQNVLIKSSISKL